MATTHAHYAPERSLLSRPRYLTEVSATASSSSAPHRRSGTLKTTPAQKMISQQRSKALYESVSEGSISIEAILAFPIDWQGIATELQWTKSRMETIDEESVEQVLLTTMNPLAIKERSRSKRNRHAVWAAASSSSATPTFSASEDDDSTSIITLSSSSSSPSTSSYFQPFSSILGLQLETNSNLSATPSSTTTVDHDDVYCASPDELNLDYSSSPDFIFRSDSPFSLSPSPSFSSLSSSSSSDSPLATPTLPTFVDLFKDSNFNLKSICTLYENPIVTVN